MVQFLAFGGALALGGLAERIGAWKTVLLSLVLWTVVIWRRSGCRPQAPLPFMVLGAAIGMVLGGSQALSRSLFSQLIPQGKEAEYFGFYEISDKGTSWLGPLAFGLVVPAHRTATGWAWCRCWSSSWSGSCCCWRCRCAGRSSPPATPRRRRL